LSKVKQPPYKLIGIDPGTNFLGFAVIQVANKEMKLVEIGVVKLGLLENHQLKLKKIFERIQSIIKTHKPKEMAIEAPFFGKNVQSMLKLGRAQGVAIAAAVTLDVPVTEYSPRKIKQSVTGNGNASKEQISAMLTNIFKVDMSKHTLDATDALATAACHFYQSSSILGSGKRYNSWDGFLKDNPGRKG
jgi:crossover junction endodeoxyribonuclease RuvC